MVLYEVYLRPNCEEEELIGVLPERREDKDRIDPDSVMNWSRTLFGNVFNAEQLLFVQKTIQL